MSDSFSNPLDWLFLILIVGGLFAFVVLVIVSAVRRFLGDRWRRGNERGRYISRIPDIFQNCLPSSSLLCLSLTSRPLVGG